MKRNGKILALLLTLSMVVSSVFMITYAVEMDAVNFTLKSASASANTGENVNVGIYVTKSPFPIKKGTVNVEIDSANVTIEGAGGGKDIKWTVNGTKIDFEIGQQRVLEDGEQIGHIIIKFKGAAAGKSIDAIKLTSVTMQTWDTSPIDCTVTEGAVKFNISGGNGTQPTSTPEPTTAPTTAPTATPTATPSATPKPTPTPTANPSKDPMFKDVAASHWAREFIEAMAEMKVINGYEDGTFKPENNITRVEFLALLTKTEALSTYKDSVNDVSADFWGAVYVQTGIDKGIIPAEMYADGNFYPDQLINREEMACMIVNAYKAKSGSELEAGESTFADEGEFAGWTTASINAAAKAQIVNGKGDNRFEAKDNATRAEAATIVKRLYDKI